MNPMEDAVFLRLFVAGKTERSRMAIDSIKSVFDVELAGKGTLEVIDILEKPEVANEEQVLVTPTLIRLEPKPVLRLIGDFSDGKKALHLLDLGKGPA